MKGVAVVTAGLVVAVAAFVMGETNTRQKAGEMDQRMVDSRREERIFAFYTTTSIKRLATTTITAVSTCLSITDTPGACNGRRKRSMFTNLEYLDNQDQETVETLDGSKAVEGVSSSGGHREMRAAGDDREGKRLTIWTSFISTLTLTSTSYLAGTTVTATALCTAPGTTGNTCFGR